MERSGAFLQDARLFWRVSGGVFLLLALAGLALAATGQRAVSPFLAFDAPHDAIHLALAAVALALGFAPLGEARLRRLALAFGIAYLALAALGLLSPGLFGFGRRAGLRLEIVENLVHLALGAWGARVGTSR